MCLLIVKPPGIAPNYDALENGHYNNDDGCGFAAAVDGKLVIEKGMWSFDRFREKILAYEHCPMLIHFRLATHGAKCKELCHPFQLPAGWAFGHNGVFECREIDPLYTPKKDVSDTTLFAEKILAPVLSKYPRAMESAEFCDGLRKWCGYSSKLAFQHEDGRQFILDESVGEHDGDIWYSNSGYRYKTSCYGGCGWDRDDDWRWAGSRYASPMPDKGGRKYYRMTEKGWQSFDEGDPNGTPVDPYEDSERTSRHLEIDQLTCDYCGDKIEKDFDIDWDIQAIVCPNCGSTKDVSESNTEYYAG